MAVPIHHGTFDVVAQLLDSILNVFQSRVVLCQHGVFNIGRVNVWVEGKFEITAQDVGGTIDALEAEPCCVFWSSCFQLWLASLQVTQATSSAQSMRTSVLSSLGSYFHQLLAGTWCLDENHGVCHGNNCQIFALKHGLCFQMQQGLLPVQERQGLEPCPCYHDPLLGRLPYSGGGGWEGGWMWELPCWYWHYWEDLPWGHCQWAQSQAWWLPLCPWTWWILAWRCTLVMTGRGHCWLVARTVSTWGYEWDWGDLVPFLGDEEHCDSAHIDGLLFLSSHGGETSQDLLNSCCFLGLHGPWSEISQGGMFARTIAEVVEIELDSCKTQRGDLISVVIVVWWELCLERISCWVAAANPSDDGSNGFEVFTTW